MHRLVATLLLPCLCLAAEADAPPALDACNVIFDTPSADASGAVPLGNGEAGASAWLEADGDLVPYLARPGSLSESGRLLKLGKVRVSLTPAPLGPGSRFRQELKLHQGRLEADLGAARRGRGQRAVCRPAMTARSSSTASAC